VDLPPRCQHQAREEYSIRVVPISSIMISVTGKKFDDYKK